MTSRGTRSLQYTHTRPRWWSLITIPPQTAYTFLEEPKGPNSRVHCRCQSPESMGFFFFLIGFKFTMIGTKPRYRVSTARTALSHLRHFGKLAYWFVAQGVHPGAPLAIFRLFRGLFAYPLHRGTSSSVPESPTGRRSCLIALFLIHLSFCLVRHFGRS
jgi:hypothetical protein